MWVVFWVLLSKLGIKLLPVLIKLLKGGTGVKAAFAVGSFALWDLFFSWQFVAVLMSTLFVHEYGHIWAMKKVGMKTRGFYFIPLFGGVAVPDSAFPSRKAEAYVALMGPLWGGLIAIPFLVLWGLTNNALWAGIASWIGMVNLFNLIPVMPLDGGRVLRSVTFSFSRRAGLITMGTLFLLGSVMSASVGLYLFTLFFILGGIEILYDARLGPKVFRLNAVMQTVKSALPSFDFEMFMHLVFAKKGKWTKERIKWRRLSWQARTRVGRLVAFWKMRHVPITPDDPVKFMQALILWNDWNDMDAICKKLSVAIQGNYAWGRPHDHSKLSPAEMLTHQYHITAHLRDVVAPVAGGGVWDSHKMYLNSMNQKQIALSLLFYATLAVSLVCVMLVTRDVPGAKEALAIFMQ